MANSISINPASITERQHLSARQIASLNKSVNASNENNLDNTANTPAYILDLSDQAINRAANQLQAATEPAQQTDIANSPAYILDISNESLRIAEEQNAASAAPKILKPPM